MKYMVKCFQLVVVTGLFLTPLTSGAAWGQDHYAEDIETDSFTDWMAEDYEQAEPLPLPRVDLDEQSFPLTITPDDEVVGSDAALPKTKVPPTEERVHDPLSRKRETVDAIQEVVQNNVGPTLPAPFTSSRVYPLSSDRARIFRTVGRLFFQTPAGPMVCSAVVVGPRVLATAGHCLHPGGPGRRFYSAFSFVPAYRNGAAPFGTCLTKRLHR